MSKGVSNLEKIAFKNLYELETEEDVFRYLRIWWSNYYKRPSKDPLLEKYTFEELLLEFFEQNLKTNKQRFEEVKDQWFEECLSDEEWVKKEEEKIGAKITRAEGHGEVKEVHDDYSKTLSKGKLNG